MEITTRKEKGKAVLAIKGRLDAGSSPDLEREIEKVISEGENRLILDLSELNYISSAGLRIILAGAKRLKAKQGTISVASLQSMVKEVFEVSGFNSIIPIFDSPDQAINAVVTEGGK